jgi:hypothetical protein
MRKMIWLVGLLLAFAVQLGFAGDLQSDCYPGNGVLIASGPTSARGEGKGTVVGISTDRHGTVTDRGSAKVSLEFAAKITGANNTANNGTSKGEAELNLHWLDTSKTGGITDTEFESGCVIEIETGPDGKVGEFEGEYEGSVKNFPGYPGTSKAAVLSILVLEDPNHSGRLAVTFSIDLGYQCFEDVYNGNDITLGAATLDNLDPREFKITNVEHGRASLPDLAPCSF